MSPTIAMPGTFPKEQNSYINELDRKTVVGEFRSIEFVLRHHTAGYEAAGSMARLTNEKWSVRFMLGGAYHGRSFSTESAARDYFDGQKVV